MTATTFAHPNPAQINTDPTTKSLFKSINNKIKHKTNKKNNNLYTTNPPCHCQTISYSQKSIIYVPTVISCIKNDELDEIATQLAANKSIIINGKYIP